MNRLASSPVIQRTLPPPAARPADARAERDTQSLLAEFKATEAEEVFTEIVRRYGGMVLNVCQRVAGNRHDAEDAAQAVFIVLAERLRAGETIHSLGSWLQRVAERAAIDVRRSRVRRRRREQVRASDIPEAIPPVELQEEDALFKLVRAELDQVPAKYRIPLVLHYFGGLDYAETARELGIKPSTLGVRLLRGRRMLAERLERRGVAAPAVALPAILAAVVRHGLSQSMLRAMAKGALTGGTQSPSASLASGIGGGLSTLLLSSKLKVLAVAALLAAAAVGARAAVRLMPDLPAHLDFRPFVPSLPSFRSHLPTLRAQVLPSRKAEGGRDASPVLARAKPLEPILNPAGLPMSSEGKSNRLAGPLVVPAVPSERVASVPVRGGTMPLPINEGRSSGGVLPASAGEIGATRNGPIASNIHARGEIPFSGGDGYVPSGPHGRGPASVTSSNQGNSQVLASAAPWSSQPSHTSPPPSSSVTSTAVSPPTYTSMDSAGSAMPAIYGTGSPVYSNPSATAAGPGTTTSRYTPAWLDTRTVSSSALPYVWRADADHVHVTAPDTVQILFDATAAVKDAPELATFGLGDLPAAFPAGCQFLEAWGIETTGSFPSMELRVRYEDQLLASAHSDPTTLQLWEYDGGWKPLTRDVSDGWVSGQASQTTQLFAISVPDAPEPTTLSLTGLVAVALLLRRPRKG